MCKQILLIGLVFILTSSNLVCQYQAFATLITTYPSIVLNQAGTDITNSSLYNSITGINYNWTSNVIVGTTKMSANISGWAKTDGTVIQITINSTQLNSVVLSSANDANKNVVRSQNSSTYGNATYFGFKASQGWIDLTFTPSATSGGFNFKIRQYGWNDGLICKSQCSYTLSLFGSNIGQYTCYEKNSLFIGILTLLLIVLF